MPKQKRMRWHCDKDSKFVGLICDVNVTLAEIMELSIWSGYQHFCMLLCVKKNECFAKLQYFA